MLQKKPENRFDATQCLQHEFFSDIPQDELGIDLDLNNLKDLTKNAQNGFDQGQNSFVQRDNVINGNLNTFNDTDSKGGIQSLRGVENNDKKYLPRTSIYRNALMKDKNK